VPLIAVHLFVFYFGIMADVTPPVGLASFAAAAVSGGDPIKTGVIAFWYSMRTAALPFLFIYNPALLLIGVGWVEGIFVFVIATIAMLVFAAALQGWFIDRCRIWEIPIMLLIAFSLFRPGFWMDTIYPPFERRGGDAFVEVVGKVDPGTSLQFRIAGSAPSATRWSSPSWSPCPKVPRPRSGSSHGPRPDRAGRPGDHRQRRLRQPRPGSGPRLGPGDPDRARALAAAAPLLDLHPHAPGPGRADRVQRNRLKQREASEAAQAAA
jgi:hypothetical protein